MNPWPFHPHRSPVYAAGGMVATSQPSAVLAGIDTLRAGGNAVDAAIATAAALAVTEPTGCGLGGDCFALVFDARSQKVLALNGSGRAPAGLDLALLQRQGLAALPPLHAHTVTVPGAVAGWCDLVARLGTRPLAELLAPAIRLAEDGFAVAPKTAYFWQRAATSQLRGPDHPLLVDQRAPRTGEIFRNPALAGTLERIADQGAEGFYQGTVAEAVAAAVKEHGGVMTTDDLAAHRSTWEEPITTLFAGKRVHECPPSGQGLTALLALNVLEELGDLGPAGSAVRLHAIIESLRLAFADARRYIADPAFARVPVAELLSPDYARERARLVDRTRATADPEAGRPHAHSDTVYLTVVDKTGNACSFIQSNYMGVGTGIAPRNAGFTLQNRGHNFSLDPDHANALAPGKRPYHTIIPAMTTSPDDGSLHASFGVMGGFMQPQGHVQVLLAMLVDDLDAQAALDRPRLCIGLGGDVALEQGVPGTVREELAAMGHAVRVVRGHERALFGRGQIITREADGVLCGGSDLRADGCALGI
jgi:gamma-glutamyltranspeptidase/glutathione hydrolase